jgi:hypothetical protein
MSFIKDMKRTLVGFLAISILLSSLWADDRGSSFPYITGDTFRAYADFIVDETEVPFFPERVSKGNTIFVKTDYLETFFTQLHPLIPEPYILLTHNSDFPAPGHYGPMLEDPKLIVWFAQNVENFSHPKLHPLPIGIANRRWEHGNPSVFDEVRSRLFSKEIPLYMNFTVQNCFSERLGIYNRFINEPFCVAAPTKRMEEYLADLAKSCFVLSPRGNGLDCHRTWEALYLRAIPIVRTSSIDSLFEGLPVIIIEDWKEVTESFLEKKYQEMESKPYQWEKLDAGYWFALIDSYKN